MLIDIHSKNGEYNFAKLDQVLDFLVGRGLKPFIDLEEKPRRINANTDIAILYVWYGGYGIAGGSGIFPDFMIDLQHREINFWEAWKQQALPPDFISVMNYAYENSAVIKDHLGKRSTDESYRLHIIRQLRQELNDAGFTQVPIYITEWNLTVSDRNYVNDSCFQGAYIVKNVIDAYREADMLAYFTGSDRTSEYYDSGQLLHGGQGLLTKDGIFKPAAFAVEFLNHMYAYYINHSDHFLLTGDQRGNYGIICHNMKSLSSYYYLSSEDQIEKDKVWRCFEDRDGLELDLCLTDVVDGNYRGLRRQCGKGENRGICHFRPAGVHHRIVYHCPCGRHRIKNILTAVTCFAESARAHLRQYSEGLPII